MTHDPGHRPPPPWPPPRRGSPVWWNAAFWVSLIASAVLFSVAGSGEYLGDCSYETGYEPEVGAMGSIPLILLVIGATEAVIAVAVRENRPPWNPLNRLPIVGGLLLCASSIVSFVMVDMEAYAHACD